MNKLTPKPEWADQVLLKGFEYNENVMILTGVNGAGKTRMLHCLIQGNILFSIDGEELNPGDMKFISPDALKPNFESFFNSNEFEARRRASMEYFEKNRQVFNQLYDEEHARQHGAPLMMRPHTGMALPYPQLAALCVSISRKLGKPLQELTKEDLRLNYQEAPQNVEGVTHFSAICHMYLKSINLNLFNQWRCERFGEDLPYVNLEVFGEPPWILMNRIIHEVLGGKFEFTEPDVKADAEEYKPVLQEVGTGRPVPASQLSTGEQTLMWTALTMFNLLYGENYGLKGPRLMMLDEPDAFLHPKMVQKLHALFARLASTFKTSIIFTTHSPTTVALAPPDSAVIALREGVLARSDKDSAISQLLDGISFISISPENRRQVFVESTYDEQVYTEVYLHLQGKSKINPKISLSFVPSGSGYPKNMVEEKLLSIFGKQDPELVKNFVAAMKGEGDCSQVLAAVEKLIDNGNKSVRGVVDWDLQARRAIKCISVFAKDHAYTMENVVLDPVAVMCVLNDIAPKTYPISMFCGTVAHFTTWLESPQLLQASVDWYIERLVKSKSERDSEVKYVGRDFHLLSDRRYLIQNGHDIPKSLIREFRELGDLSRGNGNKLTVTVNSRFLQLSGGSLIPAVFEDLFTELQLEF